MSPRAQELLDELHKKTNEHNDTVGPLPCETWPDLFFIDGTEKHYGWLRITALNMCEECPLKQLCLDYAMEAREEFGIWGGTTAGMRRKLRYLTPASPESGQSHARSAS